MIRKIIMLFAVTLCVIGCAEDMVVTPITYDNTRGLKLTERAVYISTCGKYPTVDCKDSALKDSAICKNPVDSIWFKPNWILVDFLDDNLEKKGSLSEVYYGGPLTQRNFSQSYWHVRLVGEWTLLHTGEDSLSDTSRALDTLNRYVDILIDEGVKVCMDDELAFEKIADLVKNEKYSLDVAEYTIKNEQRKVYSDSARLFFTDKKNVEALFR
ncbi:MAG: hypothetical protein IKN03_08405 [Fibrobacter sp.]|nr:hypothetical protein [Fibrobacter sp.]